MIQDFKTALFGYKKKQVDEHLAQLHTEKQAQDAQAKELGDEIHRLEQENSKLVEELKVAKGGYADAAGLMREAREKVRALEASLEQERLKAQQLEDEYQKYIEQIQRDNEDYLQAIEAEMTSAGKKKVNLAAAIGRDGSDAATMKILEGVLSSLRQMHEQTNSKLHGLKSDVEQAKSLLDPDNRFEQEDYNPPEGMESLLDADASASDARGLMQRIFRLRAGADESEEPSKASTPVTSPSNIKK